MHLCFPQHGYCKVNPLVSWENAGWMPRGQCSAAHAVQTCHPAGCLLAGHPRVSMLRYQDSLSRSSAPHEEATVTLLPLLSHLLLPMPFLIHRHSSIQRTIFGYQAVQIRFNSHDSCLWGFEVSAHFLRQSWYLGTGETWKLHEVEWCKHAVPCARRMHICLKQQTRPLVCSVLDSFNLFLTSIPTWEAFSLHIDHYVSCFCSWPLFSH